MFIFAGIKVYILCKYINVHFIGTNYKSVSAEQILF